MVVVKNLTAATITPVEIASGTLEKLDEMQGIWQNRMSAEWRKEMLFQQLPLSGLEGWSIKNQAATHVLLAEYHDIFSLEPDHLGCTDQVKHEIRGIDDKPFKERFRRIPPLIVDEIHAHVKEMLEVGAICPSKSP